MMTPSRFASRVVLALFFLVPSLPAQNLGTGTYALGTYDNRGFDTINVGNLNMHAAIPIVNKLGRGMPFNYYINYESLIWSATGTGPSWQPDQTFGFHGYLYGGLVGYLTESNKNLKCVLPDQPAGVSPETYNFVYHDTFGRSHRFNYTVTQICGQDSPTITGDGSTSDGSGYYYSNGYVYSSDGKQITPNTTAAGSGGAITDANGNTITNNPNGTYTDTLGVTALTITGGGNASSPLKLTYPVTEQADNATTASVTITYRTYTVQTNFQCSGITEYPATSTDLIDRITQADGSYYAFTYESTPSIGGAVTGRLASVTLPTGGTIGYQYSGGCNGSGINADGTVAGLTRTTTDGTRSYTRTTVNSNASSTTLQDEALNQTAYQFSSTNGLFYETHRQVYAGQAGGTLLYDLQTCYNGATSNCDGASITPPLTSTIGVATYTGGSSVETDTSYNSASEVTGSTIKQGGSTLITTGTGYNSLGEVTAVSTVDGSNNFVAQTKYGYDETSTTATSGIPQHQATSSGTPGNLTTTKVYTGPSTTIASTTAYYDTGQPVSTTTPNGTTSYSYDSTQTFTTSATAPTPSSGATLAVSAFYDAQTGAALSATGMNSGQTVQYKQYDRMLRSTSVRNPDGGSTTVVYGSPNQVGVLAAMTSGSSADTETIYDGYGRTVRVGVANGQSANPWYLTDSCYNAMGQLQFQSARYAGASLTAAMQCSGNGTTYSYDALGRVTQKSGSDGYTVNYTYTGRAVKRSDSNGVSKITQYDALGRISGVCEISSNGNMPGSGSPVSCGMDISGTGFLTSYTYSLSAHTTTVTQGAQTRVFQTDAAGRTVMTQEPERGQTNYTYAYNSTGLVVTRTRPQANQTDATVLTTTTTQYDAEGRVLSVSYSDNGLTPAKTYQYDVAQSSQGWQSTPTNTAGQLAQMTSGSGSSLTRTQFSYDLMGRPTTTWQCGPSICATPNQNSRPAVILSYDLAGNVIGEADGASGSITYERSPAGEVTSITGSYSDANNPPNLVSNVVNGPSGPLSYTLGNGLSVVNTYDGLGRANQGLLCSAPGCPSNTQVYGWAEQYAGARVLGGCDTVQGYCQSVQYDEFNRLTGAQSAFGPTQMAATYSYDRYGNRWAQNQGYAYDVTTNQYTGFLYDAAGNVRFDGSHQYTYDAEGNVLAVDGGSTATYVYDALNRRVSAPLLNGDGWYGTAEEEMYDPLGRLTSSWAVSNNFGNHGRIYWDGRQVAFRAANGKTYFEHKDWNGNERMRTDPQGNVALTETSLPFGENFVQTSPDSDQWGWMDTTGYGMLDYDVESGTHHAQFRQYSSTAGRWMSPDPYDGSYRVKNPQSLNRYVYALNNPFRYTDPLGLDQADCTEVVHGGIRANDDGGGDDSGDGPGDGYIDCVNKGGGGGDPNNPGECDNGNCTSVGGGVTNDPGNCTATVCVTPSPFPYPEPDPTDPDPCGAVRKSGIHANACGPQQPNNPPSTAPSNPQQPTQMPPHTPVCYERGCVDFDAPPNKYQGCVATTTAAGAAGGLGRGLWLAIFTEGTSIPISVGGGASAGFLGGLVACAFK